MKYTILAAFAAATILGTSAHAQDFTVRPDGAGGFNIDAGPGRATITARPDGAGGFNVDTGPGFDVTIRPDGAGGYNVDQDGAQNKLDPALVPAIVGAPK